MWPDIRAVRGLTTGAILRIRMVVANNPHDDHAPQAERLTFRNVTLRDYAKIEKARDQRALLSTKHFLLRLARVHSD